ncbi:MAG: galactokinase [Phycisphaerae bacterium]|nr:galactokinase [Phycisphaerae bacterium]
MNSERTREAFAERFGRPCSVVTRAPGRVNLIGEHTDYNDGFVLPLALEHNTWVACAVRQDALVRLISLDMNDEQTWPADGWRMGVHAHWTSYVAGVASLLAENGARVAGFDMLVTSEVPLGGGLSSSAALEVSAALALATMVGEKLDSHALADLARAAEHKFAGVPCGIMDQYISVLGKRDTALLLDCRTREHEYIPLELKNHVVLIVNSGVRHELAEGEYGKRQKQCHAAVEYFKNLQPNVTALRDVTSNMVREHASKMEPLDAARAMHVTSEDERTVKAAEALRKGDLAALGPLLAGSHASLRDDYEVSCPELDQLVEIVSAVDGVVGARMTGGGFGGSIVAIAETDCVPAVQQALSQQYDTQHPTPAKLIQTRPGAGAAVEFS